MKGKIMKRSVQPLLTAEVPAPEYGAGVEVVFGAAGCVTEGWEGGLMGFAALGAFVLLAGAPGVAAICAAPALLLLGAVLIGLTAWTALWLVLVALWAAFQVLRFPFLLVAAWRWNRKQRAAQ